MLQLKKEIEIFSALLTNYFSLLENLLGYDIKVYTPVGVGLYESDSDITFSANPVFVGKALIVGLFNSGYRTSYSDDWVEEYPVWYRAKGAYLPDRNYKVEVYLDENRILPFKVINIEEYTRLTLIFSKIYLEAL